MSGPHILCIRQIIGVITVDKYNYTWLIMGKMGIAVGGSG
jgi:hypothetical protein